MEVRGVSVQNVNARSQTRGKRTMSNADIRGRFVWHELMTTDTDAAAAFYSKVVPWKTQDSGMPSYTLWMAGKTQVGGLTGLPSDGSNSSTPPHWIVYVATPDVDATVAEAERLGGKVLKSATDIPNMGRYAVLIDPQGATFAVYSAAGDPPADGAGAAGGPGEFTWHELATTDYAAAMSFYTELFGWEKGDAHDMGGMGIYQLINHGGAQVGGIYNLQAPSTPAHWLSYVRVPDCTKATNAAKAAGGRVLNGPMEVPGGSWITMMEDPQGGAFAVVEPPKAQAQKPAAKKAPAKAKGGAKADASAAKLEAPAAAPAETVGKAAAKKAAGKAAAKKSKKAPAKGAGAKKAAAKKAPAKKPAGKKAAKKVAKKAAKKVAKSTSAKRGKSAAKKSAKKAKRR